MQTKMKKILSLVLCVAMILPVLTMPIFAFDGTEELNTGAELLSDANKDGMDAVTSTQTVTVDGVDYIIERTTRCIGTRTYSVQIRLRSAVESTDAPAHISSAQNGYMTVTQAGWYLLELWGGDGADGADNVGMGPGHLLDRKTFDGGNGANGGYVYGKVWLEAGQTLVYTIGTNGSQSLASDSDAGGENGEGGIHGAGGSLVVGSGGGFSALYFFDKGEFDTEWVTTTGVNIPENARLSKYVMIAGGGGGGGAGAGTAVFPYDDNFAPNGGTGGTVTNGASVTLKGESYAVEGYIFSGANGRSSHTSNEYVGIGGTAVPGPKVQTELGLTVDQRPANDWTGTHTDESPYGAGGTGNFRGGGGGAGFTGGSGGNMTSSLVPSNVGGGGGGSSFIADHVTYLDANGNSVTKQVFYDIANDERAKPYLMPTNVADSNRHAGVGVGGACEITYLGNDDDLSLHALQNVTFTGTVSRYFTVNQTSSASTGTISYSENASGETTVTATGLDISPSATGVSSKVAAINLVVVARSDFAGGNSVKMVHDLTARFLDPHDTSKTITLNADKNDTMDFVNVPLRMELKTKSYTTSITPKSYNVTDFYEDSYASVRNSLSSYWQYDYINSIGNYEVYLNDSKVTGTVSVSSTTTFSVRYTVTLKTSSTESEVTVGPVNEISSIQTKNAVVSIVPQETAVLNNISTTVSRGLEYTNGQYLFKVNLDQTTEQISFPSTPSNSATSGNGSYEVKISGWYYIQAWGGNGQASQGTRTLRYNGDTRISVGGASGGAGNYVSGYIYLKEGTFVDYVAGAALVDPAAGTYWTDSTAQHPSSLSAVGYSDSPGGTGGNYTSVSIGGTPLLIAGGGGGGGGSAAASTTGLLSPKTGQGTAGKTNTTVSNTLLLDSNQAIDASAYNGETGEEGDAYAKYPVISNTYRADGGDGGDGGSNYRYSELTDGYDYTGEGRTLTSGIKATASSYTTSKSSGKAGQVSITLLESDDAIDARENLSESQIEIAISQYFDVVGVTAEGNSVTFSYTSSPIDMADNGTGTYLSIATSYTASIVKESTNITYKASPTVIITLEPKDGFLGGNDVPVVLYDKLGGSATDAQTLPDRGVRVTKGTDFMHSPAVNTTDFANVELNYDFEVGVGETPVFETNDKTVMLGESLRESELYTVRFPSYTGEDAWKDDFVTFTPPTDNIITPTKTAEYALSVGLEPIGKAEKAIIQASVDNITYSLTATVYVNVSVVYDVENLTSTGVSAIPYGTEYRFEIAPVSGYLLPDSVRVYIVDGESRTELVSGVSYRQSSGEVVISASAVTGHLEIVATAKIRTYSIYVSYAYDVAGNTAPNATVFDNGGAGYAPGASIDVDALLSTIVTPEAIEGYTYAWAYDTADGEKPTVMPANDLWIYGSYEKNVYTLTVYYYYEGGAQVAAEAVTKAVIYGDSYSVTSPIIKGYRADPAIVAGTLSTAGNVEITVTYYASEEEVTILLLRKDGTELREAINETLTTGQSKTYRIAEEYAVEGYTPEVETVTVNMDGDSQTVIVYYLPNVYNVTFSYQSSAEYPDFDFSSATLAGGNQKSVTYDEIYGYDSLLNEYNGLPTPQIAGFTFLGWYLDGAKVTETSTVKTASDHTLVARWDAQEFKLIIKYSFIYEAGDYLPDGKSLDDVIAELTAAEYVTSVKYGNAYSIKSPVFTGYKPYTNFGFASTQKEAQTVSGTMPAQNLVILVDYAINVYTVTFKDLSGKGITYSDWDGTGEKPASVASDAYGTTWTTIKVKHDVAPVYPLGQSGVKMPSHNENRTNDRYTYQFLGWMNADGSKTYDGVSALLDNATEDFTYYTRFHATENIIGVKVSSINYYFTNVREALAFAKANLASATTLTFRRNAHNGKSILLNGDTLVFDADFAAVGGYSLTVDVRGYALYTTNGESVVDNRSAAAFDLVLADTSATPGSMTAEGSGNVIAVNSASGSLTVSAKIAIAAASTDADATAIRFATKNGASCIASGAWSLTASAPVGTAIGLHLADTAVASNAYTSLSSSAHAITAMGRVAYGVKSEGLGSFGSSSYGYGGSIEARGETEAYGIYGAPAAYLSSTATVTVNASETGGVAYGLKEVAAYTATASAPTFTVNAPLGTAYGFTVSGDMSVTYGIFDVSGKTAYGIIIPNGATLTLQSLTLDVSGASTAVGIEIQAGGTLVRSGSTTSVIRVSSSNGSAYGVKNHGTVSSITANITATAKQNAYGLYNADGTVTASGINSTAMRTKATSTEGNGYGLYSAGGSVGTSSDCLDIGVFEGSSYGIYCTDGSIYVSGNNLYFKGADEENAIYESTRATYPNGVQIKTGYLQVAANAGTSYEGFYRLGREWTITFVTNGGNEIESITQIYDTPLTAPEHPKKLGYEFLGWYSDEAFSTAYNIPTRMPDGDKTLYARWNLITYIYTYDTETTPLKVTFNTNPPTGTNETKTIDVPKGQALSKDDFSDADATFIFDFQSKTYVSGKVLYIFTGWYSSSARTEAGYVSLNSDLCLLDTNGDGEITLYGGWQKISNCLAYDSISHEDRTAKSFSTEYYSSYNYYYMYYVVPADGTYVLQTGNYHSQPNGNYTSKYRYVHQCTNSSSDLPSAINTSDSRVSGTVKTSKITASNVDNNYVTSYTLTAKAGEVLVVRWYRYSSGTSYLSTKVYARISSITLAADSPYSDVSELLNPSFVASRDYRTQFEYDVTMGDVSMEVPTKSGYQFLGWSEQAVTADKSQMMITLTPSLVDELETWRNRGVLDLYSQWGEITWDSYYSPDRHMTYESVLSTDVGAIRKDGTITLRFQTEHAVDAEASFRFSGGLTAGTILTLIDFSDGTPVYYTYTVTEDGVTEVLASSFTEMGSKANTYHGQSNHVLLQICYANADVAIDEETVGIVVDDLTPEIELTYRLLETAVTPNTGEDVSMTYLDTRETVLTVPAISGTGLASTDRIFIRVSWGELTMAPGVIFTMDGATVTSYGNHGIVLATNLTLSDLADGQTMTLYYTMETMRFCEFEGREFTFELYAMPDGKYDGMRTIYASDIALVASFTQILTLTETPTLQLSDTIVKTVAPNGTLNIGGISCSDENAEILVYLYELDSETGVYSVTASCEALLSADGGYRIDGDGRLIRISDTAEELPVVTNGELELPISESAAEGIYYLKFVSGDKFLYLPFRVFIESTPAN